MRFSTINNGTAAYVQARNHVYREGGEGVEIRIDLYTYDDRCSIHVFLFEQELNLYRCTHRTNLYDHLKDVQVSRDKNRDFKTYLGMLRAIATWPRVETKKEFRELFHALETEIKDTANSYLEDRYKEETRFLAALEKT